MLSHAAPQLICARHSPTPTMTTAMPRDAIVLGVRRRLVSDGGASLTSVSPRTSVVVTGPTVSRGPNGSSTVARCATGPRSDRIRRASHPRQQWSPGRNGAAPRDGALALREHACQLVQLSVLVAFVCRSAVPLADLIDALERGIGNGDGAQFGGAGLDDPPHPAIPTEMGIGANGGAKHGAVKEMECRPVPGGHLGLRRRRFRIADEDLPDGTHRKERSLAVLVDRTQLRVEDREIKGDLGGLGENDLTVDEIDDDDGHLKSVTFRSQVPPSAAVASTRR